MTQGNPELLAELKQELDKTLVARAVYVIWINLASSTHLSETTNCSMAYTTHWMSDEQMPVPQNEQELAASLRAPTAPRGESMTDPGVIARLEAFETVIDTTLASIPEHPDHAYASYIHFATPELQHDLKTG
jgi:hypothetical protein